MWAIQVCAAPKFMVFGLKMGMDSRDQIYEWVGILF